VNHLNDCSVPKPVYLPAILNDCFRVQSFVWSSFIARFGVPTRRPSCDPTSPKPLLCMGWRRVVEYVDCFRIFLFFPFRRTSKQFRGNRRKKKSNSLDAPDDPSPGQVSQSSPGRRVGDDGDGSIVTTARFLKLLRIMAFVRTGIIILLLYRNSGSRSEIRWKCL
jgi:hypothetical protein